MRAYGDGRARPGAGDHVVRARRAREALPLGRLGSAALGREELVRRSVPLRGEERVCGARALFVNTERSSGGSPACGQKQRWGNTKAVRAERGRTAVRVEPVSTSAQSEAFAGVEEGWVVELRTT